MYEKDEIVYAGNSPVVKRLSLRNIRLIISSVLLLIREKWLTLISAIVLWAIPLNFCGIKKFAEV